jgi:regulator of RNase E activity RraA
VKAPLRLARRQPADTEREIASPQDFATLADYPGAEIRGPPIKREKRAARHPAAPATGAHGGFPGVIERQRLQATIPPLSAAVSASLSAVILILLPKGSASAALRTRTSAAKDATPIDHLCERFHSCNKASNDEAPHERQRCQGGAKTLFWGENMLKTFNDFERRPDLIARCDALLPTYSISAIFADVMYRQNIMHSGIKPAFRAKVCGQAITVQLSGGDLVDPLKALEMGAAGDVIVVDAGGDTEVSVCGGLMGGLAKNRGIRGMIVDGAGRDTDELEDINWPIWTRAITPRGTHTMFSGRKEELSINVPIACGGVIVNPGDIIIADLIGVCVVPIDKADELITLAAEQAEREQKTREWVNQGKTVEDLLAEFGRI